MKQLMPLTLAALLTLPLLSGCGLRSELKRPEPLFDKSKTEKVEDVQEVAEVPTPTVTRQVITGPRRNANGGIIPDAAPTTPVTEGGLSELE